MTMMYEQQYLALLKTIMENGELEYNNRTGHETRRIVGAMISCDLRKEWPLLSIRRMHPKTGAAELAWMLSGKQDTKWLQQYSKIWEKFLDEEGMLRSAYGYRWRYHFKRDQMSELVELLKRDPSSRQGVVFAWDPMVDGLGNAGKSKNIPCHMGFSACVLNDRLDMCVYQRSVDTVVGLPYDVLLYGLLNSTLAHTLNVKPGVVSIAFADTHIYDSHFGIAEELIKNGQTLISLQNDTFKPVLETVDDIRVFPDRYVALVIESMKGFRFSDYAPKPEVIL